MKKGQRKTQKGTNNGQTSDRQLNTYSTAAVDDPPFLCIVQSDLVLSFG